MTINNTIETITVDSLNYFRKQGFRDYAESEVKRQVKMSIQNKANLIGFLAGHPSYDSERLRISVDVEYTKNPSILDARRRCLRLADECTSAYSHILAKFAYDCNESFATGIISEIDSDRMSRVEMPEFKTKFRSGMKVTKVVRKLIDEILEKMPSLGYSESNIELYKRDMYRQYDQMCELMATSKKQVKYYLSASYADFMRMSMGNSWDSCHHLEDGCHRAGCQSYALDGTTLIMYSENEKRALISRKIVFAFDDKLSFGRTYGDDSNFDVALETLCKSIADELGNGEFEHKENNDLCSSCMRHMFEINMIEYGMHYPDHHHHDADIYTFEGLVTNSLIDNQLVIGHDTICMMCGDDDVNDDSSRDLTCYSCNNEFLCTECGSRHDIEHSNEVDGELYCNECVVYCTHCDECFVYDSDELTVNQDDDRICQSCYEDLYAVCDDCEDIILSDDANYIEGGVYCHYCADRRHEESA